MNSESQQLSALPLDELKLTPEWLKGPARSFENHSGEERKPGRSERFDRNDREQRRERRPRPERVGGVQDRRRPAPGQGKPAKVKNKFPGPHRSDRRPDQRTAGPTAPLLVLDVAFLPEEKGFASMLEAMKQPPKAYRLFDIAKLILNKPDRHLVKLTRKPAPGEAAERALLHVVTGREAVFLSQAEAVRYVVREQGEKICRVEKKPVEPPKGSFQFVCKCGMTGEILGPSTYHEYQSRIVRHHQRRLAHVPFEQFKSRIEIIRDPEAVKAWIESMSFITEYHYLLDAEPKVFASRQELEKHFIENHLAAFVTASAEAILSGVSVRERAGSAILNRVRQEWEAEWKFPLKTANALRPRFSQEGFTFFKRQKGVSFVTKVKPKRLESLEHLAPHIQKIIIYLRENEGATGAALVTHLHETGAQFNPATLASDMHWLVTEGYVVEFSDGRMWAPKEKPPETAKPAEAKDEAVVTVSEPATSSNEVAPAVEPPVLETDKETSVSS